MGQFTPINIAGELCAILILLVLRLKGGYAAPVGLAVNLSDRPDVVLHHLAPIAVVLGQKFLHELLGTGVKLAVHREPVEGSAVLFGGHAYEDFIQLLYDFRAHVRRQ